MATGAARSRKERAGSPPPSDPYRRPWRPPDYNWQDALTHAMTHPRARAEQLFEEDDLAAIIKDGFPKARYHYLIVGKKRELNSVKDLQTSDIPLLQHMHKLAEDLIARIHRKEPDVKFRFGYHAVPSLNRLHMHVVSQDFASPRMRKQHHWNTFNTEYFMDSSAVLEILQTAGRIEVNDEYYEELLNLPMKCNQCSRVFEDIGRLKDHLRHHLYDRAHKRGH